MVDDSDTESEPESSLPRCILSEFAAAHNVKDSHENVGAKSAQNAGVAIEKLKSLDLVVVQGVRTVCSIIDGVLK